MRLGAALLLLLMAPQVPAAERGVGVSTWTVSGGNVGLRYTFPQTMTAALARPGKPSPAVGAVARYVLSRVSVRQQANACDTVDQGYDLGHVDARYAGPAVLSFEIFFRCPHDSGALVLRNDAFIELYPGQTGMAEVWVNGGPRVSRLLAAGGAAINIDAAGTLPPSSLASYVGLGLKQAFSSILYLCMACALLLLVRDRTGLIALIGGLVVGCLAAAMAGGGGWFLQPEAAHALRGFLLLFAGALLAARHSGRSRAAAAGLMVATGVAAAALGLLGHGAAARGLLGAGIFGAAAVFSRSDELPWFMLLPGALIGAVDGFSLATLFSPLAAVFSVGTWHQLACNAGLLLGTLLILAAAGGARLALRRLTPFARAPVCRDLATASLAGVGAFFMLAV